MEILNEWLTASFGNAIPIKMSFCAIEHMRTWNPYVTDSDFHNFSAK